jgi:hypothetical protein
LEGIQRGDVIDVRVSEEDVSQGEPLRLDEVEHRFRICSGVECSGGLRSGIPHDVSVHVVVTMLGVELRHAIHLDRLRRILALGQSDQAFGIQLERRGQLQQGGVMKLARFQSAQRVFVRADGGAQKEGAVGVFLAGLGLGNDVGKCVFEGYGHGVGAIKDGLCKVARTKEPHFQPDGPPGARSSDGKACVTRFLSFPAILSSSPA